MQKTISLKKGRRFLICVYLIINYVCISLNKQFERVEAAFIYPVRFHGSKVVEDKKRWMGFVESNC